MHIRNPNPIQHDQTYLTAAQDILTRGSKRSNRTDTDIIGVFGINQIYELYDFFPALTTKRLAWKAVVSELLFFIEGSGDERRLAEILHGTRDPVNKTIWTDNANADYWKPKTKFEGDLGKIYGVQWRYWKNSIGETTDQLLNLVDSLKQDPMGRRHIITAWNPGELSQMALPPCHCFAQFYVTSDGYLECFMHQRSNDFFLGCPFNIASYALLTHMLAQVCGYKPGRLIHSSGDAHIYVNHVDQVNTQLLRTPFTAPTLLLNPEINDITKFTMDDIKLMFYQYHPAIKAQMAV